jgi:hypothetical protein
VPGEILQIPVDDGKLPEAPPGQMARSARSLKRTPNHHYPQRDKFGTLVDLDTE